MKLSMMILLLACVIPTVLSTTITSKKPVSRTLPLSQVTRRMTTPHPVVAVSTHPPTTPSPFDINLVVEKSGKKCLVLRGRISMNVSGQVVRLQQSKCRISSRSSCSQMNQGDTARLVVKCGTSTQILISFTGGLRRWFMSSIEVQHGGITAQRTMNAVTTNTTKMDDVYGASVNQSYGCKNDEKILLQGPKGNITVDFSRIFMQPFYSKEVVKMTSCSSLGLKIDHSTVPIAVGCALALLVIVVFVAYLIGRKKDTESYAKV